MSPLLILTLAACGDLPAVREQQRTSRMQESREKLEALTPGEETYASFTCENFSSLEGAYETIAKCDEQVKAWRFGLAEEFLEIRTCNYSVNEGDAGSEVSVFCEGTRKCLSDRDEECPVEAPGLLKRDGDRF